MICSDGLLAGELETRALLGPGLGALTERLLAEGLTAEEIEEIVLRDPMVADRALTDATRGATLDEAVRTITRYFPPVFGAANGFASGLSLATFTREVRALAGAGGDPRAFSYRKTHPDRQKALVRTFKSGGKAVCALDIRMANARYWRAATGGRLPVAVMASPTSHAAISAWAGPQDDADLSVYEQHGVYRLLADGFAHHERWFDGVLREPDGTPSLKPPGHLGTLTCLALSGILDTWAGDGIAYLAIANGDDVGFRLDPRIVGILAADPELDVVAAGVPWGPEDQGGVICEVLVVDGWRVGVVETGGPDRFAEPPLFSTNQFVVRVAAVRRVLGLPREDPVSAVFRFVDQQPFHAERKRVGTTNALQLQQRLNVMFTRMRMAAVRLSRYGPLETRGSYAGLKRADDVAFGQWLLDTMAEDGDDLAF